MSISPSLPPGAPSLTEVVVQRTFAKPPQPFVDGDFIDALAHADDDRPSVTATAAASARAAAETAAADGRRGTGVGTDPGARPQPPAPAAPSPHPGSTIDVRA
ncbi:MAG TPA: hypothetical protein VGO71_02655 [Baekduia sp.]|nr:hypothetical protein [Baekduia sp.]